MRPTRLASSLPALLILSALPLVGLRAAEEESLVSLELREQVNSRLQLGDSGCHLDKESSQATLSFPLAGNKQDALLCDLTAGRTDYRFGGHSDLPAFQSAPLTGSSSFGVNPLLIVGLDKDWTWLLSPDLQADWAHGASFSGALRFEGSLACIHRFSSNLKAGFGLEWDGLLDGQHSLLPVFLLEWTHGDWSLSADGSSLRLTRKLQHGWGVFSELDFVETDTRLSSRSSLPKGHLHEESIPVRLGVFKKVGSHVKIQADVGANIWQSTDFEDKNNKRNINAYKERSYMATLAFVVSY